ncbi:MAG: class I SAM-dependent methyltransferase [Pyrinomonadaceae bacterium]
MNNIFSNFPKKRTPLPPEFEAIYSKHYKENREGRSQASSLAQKMESWMHKKVAEDVKFDAHRSTLEIGAGTLNHLPYERQCGSYDIVEPFRSLYESSPHLDSIRNIFNDISNIPPTAKYERIISIATFEHICNLPEVVAKSGLLLTAEGELRIGIPSEGTILWRLGYTFTTGLEFRLKYNLNYDVLMKHEHVNTAQEIEDVLRYFFSKVESSFFGIAKHLSLYQFYACSKLRLDNCMNYLKGKIL